MPIHPPFAQLLTASVRHGRDQGSNQRAWTWVTRPGAVYLPAEDGGDKPHRPHFSNTQKSCSIVADNRRGIPPPCIAWTPTRNAAHEILLRTFGFIDTYRCMSISTLSHTGSDRQSPPVSLNSCYSVVLHRPSAHLLWSIAVPGV